MHIQTFHKGFHRYRSSAVADRSGVFSSDLDPDHQIDFKTFLISVSDPFHFDTDPT